MHDVIAPLAPLLGTWRGAGRGEYPTIQPFEYADEWVFTENGKPFVAFVERTWNAEGQPMHTEAGYLRCPAPGLVEIVAALPTGQAECGSGSLEVSPAVALTVATDALVRNADSAKHVERIVRRFELSGDTLGYGMQMEAVGQPLTHHLAATLRRIGA